MLTSLGLRNFKAWERIEDMQLARITGVFGANSSGKSSILQFLLMLKQTAAASDRSQVLNLGDSRALVSLGPFRQLVTNKAQDARLDIHLAWSRALPLVVKDPGFADRTLFESDKLTFGASIGTNGGEKLVVEWMRYGLGGVGFKMRRDDGEQYKLEAEQTSFKFIRKQGRKWPLQTPTKFYGFPDEVRAYHENAGFLSELELELEKLLGAVYYLGPLRGHPLREYPWSGGDPADMGSHGEHAISAILAARERGDRIPRGRGYKQLSLEEYVAYWLKYLGLIDSFRVEEIKPGTNLYRVHVRRSAKSTEVLITDVGFGVSQILPVLVLCYYVPKGSTILLEQPEIHLHPSVQAGLADVFIDAAITRDVQLVIESHSEHLLRRLQRRVAEGEQDLSEKDVALYFCAPGDNGSSLTRLDVDLYGEIRNWPQGFFGDEMADLAARSTAAMRKRRAERA